jgi:ArsR family transcriptional regulator
MITAIAKPPARPRSERKETPPVQALPDDTTNKLVKLFKLLSDGTRLQIIHFLTGVPELNVGNLCDLLEQSQPAVSHHLALLRDASIVDMRRDGKHNFYRLRRSSLAQYQQLVNSLWDGIAAAPPTAQPTENPDPLLPGARSTGTLPTGIEPLGTEPEPGDTLNRLSDELPPSLGDAPPKDEGAASPPSGESGDMPSGEAGEDVA